MPESMVTLSKNQKRGNTIAYIVGFILVLALVLIYLLTS